MNNLSTQRQTILEQHYGDYARAFRRLSAAIYERAVDGVVITGSGLNTALEGYKPLEIINTSDIAGFPSPSVAGHSSVIRIIDIGGKRVAHFTGRCHLYEGFSMQDALAQIGLAALLGARFAVLTNAAGGLNPLFAAGDIMLLSDSHNLLFRSVQRGWLAGLKEKLPTILPTKYNEIFAREPRKQISAELTAKGVPHHHGIYVAVTGPSYETPAEARMYRLFGGHAIGMSTVHEAEFARVCGLQVAGCSLITNTLPETVPVTVSHEEVIEAAAIGAARVAEFVASACSVLA